MAEESKSTERFSLSRWSRRKLEAARAEPAADVAQVSTSAPPSPRPPDIAPVAAPVAVSAEVERPAVESLTFESDFGAFLKPDVDPATQRAALKKLFSDPRFNVMDGLDTYIDDYTQADPMPAGMLDKLGKVYALLKEDAPASDAPTTESEAEATITPPRAIEAPTAETIVPAPASPVPPTTTEPDKRSSR